MDTRGGTTHHRLLPIVLVWASFVIAITVPASSAPTVRIVKHGDEYWLEMSNKENTCYRFEYREKGDPCYANGKSHKCTTDEYKLETAKSLSDIKFTWEKLPQCHYMEDYSDGCPQAKEK